MIFELAILVLMLSMSIVMYRFLIGPTLSDRVVAFDVMGVMGVSVLVLLAVLFQRSLYLDIALVFGLIEFLGTTIFGRYIEKGI